MIMLCNSLWPFILFFAHNYEIFHFQATLGITYLTKNISKPQVLLSTLNILMLILLMEDTIWTKFWMNLSCIISQKVPGSQSTIPCPDLSLSTPWQCYRMISLSSFLAGKAKMGPFQIGCGIILFLQTSGLWKPKIASFNLQDSQNIL